MNISFRMSLSILLSTQLIFIPHKVRNTFILPVIRVRTRDLAIVCGIAAFDCMYYSARSSCYIANPNRGKLYFQTTLFPKNVSIKIKMFTVYLHHALGRGSISSLSFKSKLKTFCVPLLSLNKIQ